MVDSKGLILATGDSSRLRTFMFSEPKHLITLLGKPMIQYPLENLISATIINIDIVVRYFGNSVKEFLVDDFRFNAKHTCIFQEKRLGIAHAIHRAIEEDFVN